MGMYGAAPDGSAPGFLTSIIRSVHAPLVILARAPARVIAANAAAAEFLGRPLDRLPAPLSELGTGPKEAQVHHILEGCAQRAGEPSPDVHFDIWMRSADRVRRIRFTPAGIEGHPAFAIATLSEGIWSAEWTEILPHVVDNLPVAVEFYDLNMVPLFFNRMSDELFLYEEKDIIHNDEWWELGFPDPVERDAAIKEWNEKVAWCRENPGAVAHSEWRVRCGDNVFRNIQFRYCTIGGIYVQLLWDVTDHRDTEAQLRELSFSDPLTGLWNRRQFNAEAERAFADWKAGGLPCAVLLVDIDRFKTINDTYGHATGDAVITAVAAILQAAGFAARVGGDEFAVLLPNTDEAGASALAARIVSQVSTASLQMSARPVKMSVSIGAAATVEDDTLHGLLDRADKALYKAKREARKEGRR